MLRQLMVLALFAAVAALWPIDRASAHCQIPCGIYDDARQFDVIEEHAATIEKAMNKINELSQATPVNYHMIARWTVNKEEHAQEVQDIAHAYFLTQRVKAKDPADAEAHASYVTHVTLLHQILVAAMKCKQTTDPAHVADLRRLALAFSGTYFSDEDLEHIREHHGGR